MEKIKTLANKYFDKTVAICHDLQQHPERSGQEQRTAVCVCLLLDLDVE
jgi:Metal-dependent amidase/aminoacylase/carboxypeptidase